MTRNTDKQIEPVEFTQATLTAAYQRAKSLGLSLSEYVQSLISKDVETEVKDPWREPVPAHVSERWDREIAEFEEENKTNPRPGAQSADELIKLLDEEAAMLPDDERD